MNDTDKNNSFQTLFSEHHDALFRFCITKVHDRHIAVDIVQESFIKLWDYINKNNEPLEYPKALLFRIAYNNVIDWSRKKKTSSLDTILETTDVADTSRDQANLDQDELALVLRAVEYIPSTYREVIIMRYIDGLAVTEVAEILGEKPGAISTRLHRGLEKLKQYVEEMTS